MGKMIRVREDTYNKIAQYAASRGTTKAGAVAMLITEALQGEKKVDSVGALEKLESIEKKLNKLILLEMEK
jgi:hypothetical protein